MKKLFLTIITALIGFGVNGQVTTPTGIVGTNSSLSGVGVGVGTWTPTNALHVRYNPLNNPTALGGIRLERNDGSSQTNSLEISVTSNLFSNPTLAPGTINFRGMNQTVGANSDMSFSANGRNHQLTLLNNGNLGLGTTTPREKLQIGNRITFHDGGSKVFGDNSTWNGTSDVRIEQGGVSQIRFEQSGYNNKGGVIRLLAAPSSTEGSNIDYINHTAITIGQDSRVGIGKRIGAKMESSSSPNALDGISARLHVVCDNNNDKNPHNDFAIRFENLPVGYGAKMVIDEFGYLYRRSYPIWYKKAKAITNDNGVEDETEFLFEEIQKLKKEVEVLKTKVK